MFEMETEWGQIYFSRNVIRQICAGAVNSCGGSAVLMNYGGKSRGSRGKGNPFVPKKARADSDSILIEEREDGLYITVYVVIRFGTSINDTANRILGFVFDQMKEVMNIEPKQVLVVNTGTASKDIAPRHMEFYRTAAQAADRESADGETAAQPANGSRGNVFQSEAQPAAQQLLPEQGTPEQKPDPGETPQS